MGLCVSSRQNGRPSTVMVILPNGKLQEFKQSITAKSILFRYPNCFLCCSETMNVDSFPVKMADDDELQVGQLYFLIPVSKSQTLMTLQDLCTLAIKASAAINDGGSSLGEKGRTVVGSPPVVDEKCAVRFWGRGTVGSSFSCRSPNRGGAIGGVGRPADHVSSTK